jgi:hypothetical protein
MFGGMTALLTLAGYAVVAAYLMSSRWDLPCAFVADVFYPWSKVSLLTTLVAMLLFGTGYRRSGHAVAILAVASPVAVIVDFFGALLASTPFSS